jgi:ATPase subunit of ABC transporter with duplicated ATPase domains
MMLRVGNISKTYGSEVVLDSVTFVVNDGDRVGPVGPNGCGKTTLLRIIVGEEQADQGSVRTSPPDLPIG